MPWTLPSFVKKHNKKLKGHAASVAAKQATAMVKNGVPEATAIATANKHAHDKPKSRASVLYPTHGDKK